MVFSKGYTPWNKGVKISDEHKSKISKSLTGRKQSIETIGKLSERMMGNKFWVGKKHTDETKKKMSKSSKGVPKPGRYAKGIKRPPLSNDTKAKLSIALKGNKICLGRKLSDETKRKIGLANEGVNSGQWNGGTSFNPYCFRFNNRLKESIRMRDGRKCQLCGADEVLNGRRLDVHHIHYDRENCDPDLISLCRKCNIKVNNNRSKWESHFMELLVNREIINCPMISKHLMIEMDVI